MKKIEFYKQVEFFELDDLAKDKILIEKLEFCTQRQKTAAREMLAQFFKPNPDAETEVSAQRLRQFMDGKQEVSDIRTQRSLSNCIAFNSKNMEGSVCCDEILQLRREIDRILAQRVRAMFHEGERLQFDDSGMFWYPPKSYMGWHTNLRTPGWRMYINYAEEPGKSFFRYRYPNTGALETVWDKRWNFRLFRINAGNPFWHCVYSDTNRFSFGYKITLKPATGVGEKLKGIVRKLASVGV